MDKDYLLDLMVNVREKTIPVDEAVETICALADDDTGAEQCNLPVVNLRFSIDELKALSENLWNVEDEGPLGGGWKSDELTNLLAKIDNAIENAG